MSRSGDAEELFFAGRADTISSAGFGTSLSCRRGYYWSDCVPAGSESTCKAGDKGSIPIEEDPLQEGMATHPNILAWRIPMDRGAWRAVVHGVAKDSDMT